MIFQYGYGSIPINTIFSGLFTSILTQLFWCEQKRGTIGFDPLPYWGIRLMYQMIIVPWIPWSWIITYNHIYRWLSVNYKPITRDKLMIIWIIVLCLSLGYRWSPYLPRASQRMRWWMPSAARRERWGTQAANLERMIQDEWRFFVAFFIAFFIAFYSTL